MTTINMTDKVANSLGSFLSKLIPDAFLNVTGNGRIADINKDSGKLVLELFGVYSNNLTDSTMNKVKDVLEAKYAGTVAELISNIASQAVENGQSVLPAVQQKLSNKGYSTTVSSITKIADRVALSDSVLASKDLMSKVMYNEVSLSGKTLTEASKPAASSGTAMTLPIDIMRTSHNKFGDVEYHDQDVHNGLGNITHHKGTVVRAPSSIVNVQFRVTVSLMNVESDKVLEAIGTSRERSNLFGYMKMRAGATHFFKDFLLNLKEIDKAVERDTSTSLSDRLMSDMMRKGGFLLPEYFSDLNEAKYYIMVLSQADADTLKAKYNFDVSKPGPLTMLFNKFNILSLVLVDDIKKNMVMHDSDNPLKGTIYNYGKSDSSDEIASLFSALARK